MPGRRSRRSVIARREGRAIYLEAAIEAAAPRPRVVRAGRIGNDEDDVRPTEPGPVGVGARSAGHDLPRYDGLAHAGRANYVMLRAVTEESHAGLVLRKRRELPGAVAHLLELTKAGSSHPNSPGDGEHHK